MDERMRFVARLIEGHGMAELCREFGISRKTGYKIWDRYQSVGLQGLTDRSRRPHRQANKLPVQVENTIVRFRKEKPSWGAPKIRELLVRQFPQVKTPAISTIHAVLDRHGLVTSRRRRRYPKPQGTTLVPGKAPNDLWCADYKGEFLLGNRRYCYPLTITDFSSRYLLACEGLETTKEVYAFSAFERVFREFGLPKAIRTDNGVPFASAHSLYNLSKLSVWWLRLGIEIERIRPGHPEQNGRHERMYLTLKREATRPPGDNILQQQAKFDEFIEEFNARRPHQALDMKFPSELYTSSPRPYGALPELHYPFHDRVITVTDCGRICLRNKKVNFSKVFAGQDVGIKEVADGIWLVSFMTYDMGYFDFEANRLEPLENSFGPKVL
jgi:putative transposase